MKKSEQNSVKCSRDFKWDDSRTYDRLKDIFASHLVKLYWLDLFFEIQQIATDVYFTGN